MWFGFKTAVWFGQPAASYKATQHVTGLEVREACDQDSITITEPTWTLNPTVPVELVSSKQVVATQQSY